MTDSGALRIRGRNLEYVLPAETLHWTLPLDSIVLIAEHTTDQGPWIDDYFLTFVTVEPGGLHFAGCSFYAEGSPEVLATLQQHLGGPLKFGLVASTEWASRVIWPPALANTEYYTFTPVAPQSIREKLKEKILGPAQEYRLSRPVREYLQAHLGAEQ